MKRSIVLRLASLDLWIKVSHVRPTSRTAAINNIFVKNRRSSPSHISKILPEENYDVCVA